MNEFVCDRFFRTRDQFCIIWRIQKSCRLYFTVNKINKKHRKILPRLYYLAIYISRLLTSSLYGSRCNDRERERKKKTRIITMLQEIAGKYSCLGLFIASKDRKQCSGCSIIYTKRIRSVLLRGTHATLRVIRKINLSRMEYKLFRRILLIISSLGKNILPIFFQFHRTI